MRRALIAIVLMLAATGAGIAAASTFVTGSESFEPAPAHLLAGPAGRGWKPPSSSGSPNTPARSRPRSTHSSPVRLT